MIAGNHLTVTLAWAHHGIDAGIPVDDVLEWQIVEVTGLEFHGFSLLRQRLGVGSG